jgi:hypothetical protein
MTKPLSIQEYRKILDDPIRKAFSSNKSKSSKYKNVKHVLYDKDRNEATKQVFDSKKEMTYYGTLQILERSGKITNLKRQVKFELIPAQYGIVNGKRTCIEKSCNYYADFVYMDQLGFQVVTDVKGIRTSDYIIKRKLMMFIHGIQIKEV